MPKRPCNDRNGINEPELDPEGILKNLESINPNYVYEIESPERLFETPSHKRQRDTPQPIWDHSPFINPATLVDPPKETPQPNDRSGAKSVVFKPMRKLKPKASLPRHRNLQEEINQQYHEELDDILQALNSFKPKE